MYILFSKIKILPGKPGVMVVGGKLSRLTSNGVPPPIGLNILTGICRNSSSALSYLKKVVSEERNSRNVDSYGTVVT